MSKKSKPAKVEILSGEADLKEMLDSDFKLYSSDGGEDFTLKLP